MFLIKCAHNLNTIYLKPEKRHIAKTLWKLLLQKNLKKEKYNHWLMWHFAFLSLQYGYREERIYFPYFTCKCLNYQIFASSTVGECYLVLRWSYKLPIFKHKRIYIVWINPQKSYIRNEAIHKTIPDIYDGFTLSKY